ncbi:hypothetical protein ACB092_05G077400 [Castanea dentata]
MMTSLWWGFETDEHPKIYRMKLWATNEVHAKSKFWNKKERVSKVLTRLDCGNEKKLLQAK